MRWAHESSDEDLLPMGPPVSGGGQLSARVNEGRLARSAESDRPRAAPGWSRRRSQAQTTHPLAIFTWSLALSGWHVGPDRAGPLLSVALGRCVALRYLAGYGAVKSRIRFTSPSRSCGRPKKWMKQNIFKFFSWISLGFFLLYFWDSIIWR